MVLWPALKSRPTKGSQAGRLWDSTWAETPGYLKVEILNGAQGKRIGLQNTSLRLNVDVCIQSINRVPTGAGQAF